MRFLRWCCALVMVSTVATEVVLASPQPSRGQTRALRPNRGLGRSIAALKTKPLAFDGGPAAHRQRVDAKAKGRIATLKRSQAVDPQERAVVQSVYARLRHTAATTHGLNVDRLAPEVLTTTKTTMFKKAAVVGGRQIAMTDEFVADLMRVAVRAQAAKTPAQLMRGLAREADGHRIKVTPAARAKASDIFAGLVAAVLGHEMTHHFRQDPYRRRLLPNEGKDAIGWRRGNEHAADIGGQRLASDAGFMPEGRVLVQLFRSMRQAKTHPAVDKTDIHPHWSTRLLRNMKTLSGATTKGMGAAPTMPLPTLDEAMTFIRKRH